MFNRMITRLVRVINDANNKWRDWTLGAFCAALMIFVSVIGNLTGFNDWAWSALPFVVGTHPLDKMVILGALLGLPLFFLIIFLIREHYRRTALRVWQSCMSGDNRLVTIAAYYGIGYWKCQIGRESPFGSRFSGCYRK